MEKVIAVIQETAAEIVLPRFEALTTEQIKEKSGPGDLVTIADIEAEENVRDINEDIMLKIGQKVEHEKFGFGTIKHVDGSKVHVDFDNHGIKKLISDFLSPC